MHSSCYDTIWPADTVEFCPIEGYRQYFACGTYKLLEDSADTDGEVGQSQRRKGACRLYQMEEGASGELACSLDQELAFPAVPDLKWCHKPLRGMPLLAVADSEGKVSFIQFLSENKGFAVMDSISCSPPDTLCLSLDWNHYGPSDTELGSDDRLVVSCSDGNISMINCGESAWKIQSTWKAHEFEPWVASWDRHDKSLIFSGGDDCKWKSWDTRTSLMEPVFTNKRFDAGITSIQSHPYKEHVVAVGSYDATLRIFDTRKPQTPVQSIEVGGGVWRIKWHPSPARQDDMLLACMHDGFKVIHGGEIVERFDEHQSLAYGVDWMFDSDGKTCDGTPVASCSFYDHALYLWRS